MNLEQRVPSTLDHCWSGGSLLSSWVSVLECAVVAEEAGTGTGAWPEAWRLVKLMPFVDLCLRHRQTDMCTIGTNSSVRHSS